MKLEMILIYCRKQSDKIHYYLLLLCPKCFSLPRLEYKSGFWTRRLPRAVKLILLPPITPPLDGSAGGGGVVEVVVVGGTPIPMSIRAWGMGRGRGPQDLTVFSSSASCLKKNKVMYM